MTYTTRILISTRAVLNLFARITRDPRNTGQHIRLFMLWATVDDKALVSILGALVGAFGCFMLRFNLQGASAHAAQETTQPLPAPRPIAPRTVARYYYKWDNGQVRGFSRKIGPTN